MAKRTVQYRQIQMPQQDLTRDPMTQSTITGGSGVSTINKNIITPPSISNPDTLTPGKQPVVIPDKTTTSTVTPSTPAPVQTTPTTPVQTTPVTPVTETTALQNNEEQINQSMPGILDQNNFLRSGMTREAFEQLPFEQQKAAVDAATQSAQERKALLDQVKYYAEAKQQQGYAQKQEDNRLAREGIQTNIADIQSSQRIADATQNLSNLKQNIAFLGTGGRPVKSTAAIDAAQRQIVRGETALQLLRNTEAQYEKLGKLGVEFNANAFEEQMRKLDKELKDNVDSTVLAALQGYSAEAALASVDTPKKLFELQQKYLDQIDTSVEGLTNRQVRQMEQLQTTYTDLANKRLKEIEAETKRQEEFTKNQNTLNEAMSKAKGFMVDGNGNAVVDSAGNPIQYREDLPKPIMQDGKMVTFKYDENGRAVPDKVVTLFGPTDKELLDLRKTQLDILTKERELGINQPQVEVTTPEGMQEVAATSQKWRGKQTLQCGELVNDYLRQSMGLGKGSGLGDKNLGNTFQDKVKAIKNIGQSTTPVVGGIFAFDVETSQGNTGHTGIVTAVNADGSIEVLEANRKENSANGGVPTTGTYSADQVQNMVFSMAPEQKPIKTKEEKKQEDIATKETTALRKEFNALQEVKDYKKVTNYMNTIDINASKKTPAGDMSLVFAYMKLLDPNSTVREGEYATAKNAGSLGDKVINAYNSTLKGTILTDKQRNDFMTTAREVQKTYEDIYNTKLGEYKSYITEGGDPNSVGAEAQAPTDDREQKLMDLLNQ